MTLIEGVGDEVTDFFIVLVVLLVGWLAWCSTSITDQSIIGTVLVIRNLTLTRIPGLRANHQNISRPNMSLSSSTRPLNLEINLEIAQSVEQASTDNNDTASDCPEPSVTDTNGETSTEASRTSIGTATEEVLIQAMDSVNHDNTGLLERESKINAAESETIPTEPCTDTPEDALDTVSMSKANEIIIKLKYINDDLKVVTGSLKEMLGDFKRRHFQIELEAQKLVRLVFNGRVLQPDSQTLERCGLYNNCVVHCLVHQPRPNPVSPQTSTIENSSSFYYNYPGRTTLAEIRGRTDSELYSSELEHDESDLSRLLMRLLTCMLLLAWYTRYHYAQLFNAGTTLALYGLTAIFTVSLFSNFFSDPDNIRNVE